MRGHRERSGSLFSNVGTPEKENRKLDPIAAK
jgi:hypothetical protein